ncbi:MAG: hypothetical protein LBM69_08250 [Lachnospiraceae bacterium]|jgi:hypothetical protein|nr:hypothetical protein [Lachnospiraceae bacterium]
MAGIKLDDKHIIYRNGQPMTALHLIVDGNVRVDFPGGHYTLTKGDAIGICEICSELHFLDYFCEGEVSILSYPYLNYESFHLFLTKHPDVASLFSVSAFKQMTLLLHHYDSSEILCHSLHRDFVTLYEYYISMCSRYHVAKRELPGLEDIHAYLTEASLDTWFTPYYFNMLRIAQEGSLKVPFRNSFVSMGILQRASVDFRKIFFSIEDQYQYQLGIMQICFEKEEHDLLSYLSDLALRIGMGVSMGSKDIAKLFDYTNGFILNAKQHHLTSSAALLRIETFENNMNKQTSLEPVKADDLPLDVFDSLETILLFAGLDLVTTERFRNHILEFRNVSNRSSTDDAIYALRRQITEEFLILYAVLFEKTLTASKVPACVMMYLYFGYVDEHLAGEENSLFLYHLSQAIKDNSSPNVYTLYDWLLAIYHEEKEPSRNEFDQTYDEYIQKQKVNGALNEVEIAYLRNKHMSKVHYELTNMFPPVNKITYGRVTTYCPIFLQENVHKDLSSALVTGSAVRQAFDQLLKIDYSAFSRESLRTDFPGNIKFYTHTEYHPDMILMPNVGIRGVMWQEIEGRNRFTTSRMMLSIFHMDDLYSNILRLTAEYRWEICKRIQGTRWNDIRDKSLTSEYCDYLQFYRKNHDLSPEAKEKIRLSLQQSHGSFKEMFVRDYLIWMLFESAASPRLNKIVRSILFVHCAFSEDICQKLTVSPFYTELIAKRVTSSRQKLHQLDLLVTRLKSDSQLSPAFLETALSQIERERMFIDGVLN